MMVNEAVTASTFATVSTMRHASYPFFSLLYFMGAMMITWPACTQTFYLVRHAEKACEDCGACGLLEPEGTNRSRDLATFLKDVPIDEIYASQCLRTQLTVKPLADALGIPVMVYQTNDLQAFISELKAHNKHKHILIAGHSNQVPVMVDSLAHQRVFISDTDFDNLYVITRKSKKAKPFLVQKTYGLQTQ